MMFRALVTSYRPHGLHYLCSQRRIVHDVPSTVDPGRLHIHREYGLLPYEACLHYCSASLISWCRLITPVLAELRRVKHCDRRSSITHKQEPSSDRDLNCQRPPFNRHPFQKIRPSCAIRLTLTKNKIKSVRKGAFGHFVVAHMHLEASGASCAPRA